MTATHCSGCGRSSTECTGCAPELDPPRFCAACGKRMAVRVHPGGWAARCARCGAEPSSAAS